MPQSKIIIHSTRSSLNDRFSVLKQTSKNGGQLKKSQADMNEATRKNQRLAAQMERRPAVRAALNTPKQTHARVEQRKTAVPIKKRLDVKGRLSRPGPSQSPTKRDARGRANAFQSKRGGVKSSILKLKDGLITKSFRNRLARTATDGRQYIQSTQRGQFKRGRGRGGGRGRRNIS